MSIHLRGMYREMRSHFLALVHVLLILWTLVTAKRLILINNLLPTPIRPVFFSVDRKNHVQMLAWELLVYIFVQLVRCFLLCWRALSQFELGGMERLCMYIERKMAPKLEPSTSTVHPTETLQPDTAEAAMFQEMEMSIRASSVPETKKTAGIKYHSTPIKSIAPHPDDEDWYNRHFTKITVLNWKVGIDAHGSDTSSASESNTSDAETEDSSPPSSPVAAPTKVPTTIEVLSSQSSIHHVSSTADEITNTETFDIYTPLFALLSQSGEGSADHASSPSVTTTNTCTALILYTPLRTSPPLVTITNTCTALILYIPLHPGSNTPSSTTDELSSRPILHPTSPTRRKHLSSPSHALTRNYRVQPLISKRRHEQTSIYEDAEHGSKSKHAKSSSTKKAVDEDMSDVQVINLPAPKRSKTKIVLLLLDRPWHDPSPRVSQRRADAISTISAVETFAWIKWLTRIEKEATEMDDVRTDYADEDVDVEMRDRRMIMWREDDTAKEKEEGQEEEEIREPLAKKMRIGKGREGREADDGVMGPATLKEVKEVKEVKGVGWDARS